MPDIRVVHWKPVEKECAITEFSRSQIDKLGDRLRTGEIPSEEDLSMLALYQESLQPTSRVKQLRSIVAKLQRQRTRLSSMQDLVGFRLVVPGILDQEALLELLPAQSGWQRLDRRATPSHGYRAVHIVRKGAAGLIEMQLRTQLQHQWAELSEDADRMVPGTKYGLGSDKTARISLNRLSEGVAEVEGLELQAHDQSVSPHVRERVRQLRETMVRFLADLVHEPREEEPG